MEKGLRYQLTQRATAHLCIKNGMIGYNPTTLSFSVSNSFKDSVHSVRLLPLPSKCSCPSTGKCFHILAVYMFLKLDETSFKDGKCYSLSTIRKKRYGKEKRSGRKNDVLKTTITMSFRLQFLSYFAAEMIFSIRRGKNTLKRKSWMFPQYLKIKALHILIATKM